MTTGVKNRLLIVDDDIKLAGEIQRHLERTGFQVATAPNGNVALDMAKANDYDLVILDISFPNAKPGEGMSLDGVEILRLLRDRGDVPVLMLSSTNITSVKTMALTIGADDFVSKPFDMNELGARIDAILRRSRDERVGFKTLDFPRLRIDPGERRVWKDGEIVELTGAEFDLLYTLARRPNHVFSRQQLLESAWKETNYSVDKVVDVHVGHIRKKIEDDLDHPTFIVTVRGTGYRFEQPPE